jgi:hypothetical protein
MQAPCSPCNWWPGGRRRSRAMRATGRLRRGRRRRCRWRAGRERPRRALAHGGPRISVRSGFLHVTQRHAASSAAVMKDAPQDARPDRLADPSAARDPADDPPGAVPVQPSAAAARNTVNRVRMNSAPSTDVSATHHRGVACHDRAAPDQPEGYGGGCRDGLDANERREHRDSGSPRPRVRQLTQPMLGTGQTGIDSFDPKIAREVDNASRNPRDSVVTAGGLYPAPTTTQRDRPA